MSSIPIRSPIALTTNRECMSFRQVFTDSTPTILLTLSILALVMAPVAFYRVAYCNLVISCHHCSWPLQPMSSPYVAIERTILVYADLQLLGLILHSELPTPLRAPNIFFAIATRPFPLMSNSRSSSNMTPSHFTISISLCFFFLFLPPFYNINFFSLLSSNRRPFSTATSFSTRSALPSSSPIASPASSRSWIPAPLRP